MALPMAASLPASDRRTPSVHPIGAARRCSLLDAVGLGLEDLRFGGALYAAGALTGT
jgi:hypothetical protein